MSINKIIAGATVTAFLVGSGPQDESFGSTMLSLEDLKAEFLASFGVQAPRILEFTADDPLVRTHAAEYLQTSLEYQAHLVKYLRYTQSLGSDFDIFDGILGDAEIESLEKDSHVEYASLMQTVFGSASISGDSFFHFYLRPESYFSQLASNELAVKPAIAFPSLFERLKQLLPEGLNYQTRLVINSSVPGGSYDEESDTIHFGAHPPNVSTVMGFVHEFGHSVFRFDVDNEALVPYVSGLNEAYAELWASQIRNLDFAGDIFKGLDFRPALDDYITLRRLLGFRFHLMALRLERQVRAGTISGVEEYKAAQRELAERYLLATDFPPIVPILPQTRVAGYLPSYLLVEFARVRFENEIQSDHLVEILLQIGREIKGDLSPGHFRNLVVDLVRDYGHWRSDGL